MGFLCTAWHSSIADQKDSLSLFKAVLKGDLCGEVHFLLLLLRGVGHSLCRRKRRKGTGGWEGRPMEDGEGRGC